MAVGIASYGCYIPPLRLAGPALAQAWGSAPPDLKEKAVADFDEDALTLAALAAQAAAPRRVAALSLASTSLPYSRRVQAGLVAEALGLGPRVFVSEHTTSARAATEALILQVGLVGGGFPGGFGGNGADRGTRAGLVVAAEAPLAAPGEGDAQSAAAVALVLEEGGAVAMVEGFQTCAREVPGLQFTPAGERPVRDVQVPDYTAAAYTQALREAALPLLERLGRRIEDYRFVVLNPPEPRLARTGAAAIGAGPGQWQPAWIYPRVGDAGAAAPLLGLAAALDAARPGDRILLVAYGSGSAADAVSLVAGPAAGAGVLERALAAGRAVDYVTYLKLRRGL